MTFFAFSLYFCLLSIRYFLLFNCQFFVASLTNISKQHFFLTLPERCRHESKLFLQNINLKFFSSLQKGAGTPLLHPKGNAVQLFVCLSNTTVFSIRLSVCLWSVCLFVCRLYIHVRMFVSAINIEHGKYLL